MTAEAHATAEVDAALAVLRAGGLVAIPTETVYGLGADAENDDAVRRVFAVKGRPLGHPLIVHLGDAEQLGEWAADVPPAAQTLAEAAWPGPLTLLLRRGPRVHQLVTGGGPTVGLRVPAHRLTTELLRRFGGGIAAPSANRFGRVSPTTAAHVRADFGDEVDYVLDGGPSPVGVESTIVDCTTDPPQVLRPGGVPTEDVAALLGGRLAGASGPSRAAGMMSAHYAPRARVLLAGSPAEAEETAARHPGARVIDATAELATYARELYGWLRAADDDGVPTVVAVVPPPVGLGHAIADRLNKAAAAG